MAFRVENVNPVKEKLKDNKQEQAHKSFSELVNRRIKKLRDYFYDLASAYFKEEIAWIIYVFHQKPCSKSLL